MGWITPRRLVLFGIAMLSLSGFIFATEYTASYNEHGFDSSKYVLLAIPSSLLTKDPSPTSTGFIPPNRPPVVTVDIRKPPPRTHHIVTDAELQRLQLLQQEVEDRLRKNQRRDAYRGFNMSAILPDLPPGLSRYDLAKAKRYMGLVCPNMNQTLHTGSGPRKSLRIVAAGMGRSGSTWQFNAIIAILKEAGIIPATKHGQLHTDYALLGLTLGCPFAVIKSHQFHPYFLEKADYVFTSHRDSRDSYASLIEMSAANMFGHYFGEYLRWVPFACIDMSYERFFNNQLAEVQKIIDVLPVPKTLNATKILLAVEEERTKAATAKKPGWHQENGYHSRHVQDPEPGRWMKKLAYANYSAELMFVENLTREWLVENDYELYFAKTPHNYTINPSRLPFIISRHTALPHHVSGRCPLDDNARVAGKPMPAATDFIIELRRQQILNRPKPQPRPPAGQRPAPLPPGSTPPQSAIPSALPSPLSTVVTTTTTAPIRWQPPPLPPIGKAVLPNLPPMKPQGK